MSSIEVGPDWLTLTAVDLEAVATFYEDRVGLRPGEPGVIESGPPPALVYETPPGYLCFREPTTMPSGGVHTHFAISTTTARYDRLHEMLSTTHSVTERTFGGRRSLYVYDPAGHCLEFGERKGLETDIGWIFEVVLEVAEIDRAHSRYAHLGFERIDGDPSRPRMRLRGPFDLELWEPHLGIADARGGCHVDLGLTVDDVDAVATGLADGPTRPEPRGERMFVRDGDGHTWWLRSR